MRFFKYIILGMTLLDAVFLSTHPHTTGNLSACVSQAIAQK